MTQSFEMPIFHKVERAVRLIAAGEGAALLQILREKTYSDRYHVALRRDLSRPFAAPAAKIEIGIRALQEDDNVSFFHAAPGTKANSEEELARFNRLEMLHAQLATCYVAHTKTNEICYTQWLMGAAQMKELNRIYEGWFPPLRIGEALLEGAYTVPAFRNMGIMAAAMARIAEHAEELGARCVVTYVAQNNMASLKGCERAGFVPDSLRHEYWRLFHHTVRYEPLEDALKVLEPLKKAS